MLRYLLLGLLASSAEPPLASEPEVPSVQAARAVRMEDVPTFDARRLRFSFGVQLQSLSLRSGSSAIGATASGALELERHELALALSAQTALAAQDGTTRHTGIAGSHLKLAYRFVPFGGDLRVLLEIGAQVGYDRAWAWCTNDAAPECGYVPGGLSYAGLVGPVFHWRAGTGSVLVGFDLLVRAPRLPDAVGSSPLGLQAWIEAGFGGLRW